MGVTAISLSSAGTNVAEGGGDVHDDPDLFAAAGAGAGLLAPLAVRMRPRELAEVRGQESVLRPGSPLRRLVEGSAGPAGPISAILWGPPGTGKTTLAHLVATATDRTFVELSAVTAGVKEVREVIARAAAEQAMHGRHTVLFLDEIHRFSKAQQDALLPGVENRTVVLVAATTENPSFAVVAPLLSRSIVVALLPLADGDLADLLDEAVSAPRGLGGAVTLAGEARDHLVRLAGGDARRALTALEAAAGVALDEARSGATRSEAGTGDTHRGPEPPAVTLDHVERAMAHALVRYDRAGDQHYDVASALIKSMRGSDVDAALHYLARMLEAGEDPRFVARRIVIAASEDVGMADPTALQTAVAALHAVAQIGMPEARIVLAQAVVHVALAPKSNAAYLAVDAAIADVRAGRGGPVPLHLRGSGYAGSARVASAIRSAQSAHEGTGGGKGGVEGAAAAYRYAHDDPDGVVAQQYLPDDLAGRTDYYRPVGRGFEERLESRWRWLRQRLRG